MQYLCRRIPVTHFCGSLANSLQITIRFALLYDLLMQFNSTSGQYVVSTYTMSSGHADAGLSFCTTCAAASGSTDMTDASGTSASTPASRSAAAEVVDTLGTTSEVRGGVSVCPPQAVSVSIPTNTRAEPRAIAQKIRSLNIEKVTCWSFIFDRMRMTVGDTLPAFA